MSSTESIMNSIFSVIQNTTGAVSFSRGSDVVFKPEDLPCLVLSQGDESCELTTLSGDMECVLSFDVLIACLKGTQNYETTLNFLKRNLIIELRTSDLNYYVTELGSSAPQVEQIEGQSLYTMIAQFEISYQRNQDTPTQGAA